MCNIHEHAVLTDVMEPQDYSFIGKYGDDFMPTNDLAWIGFRVEAGLDGGDYLLVWHDQDICGNAFQFPNIVPRKCARPAWIALRWKEFV